jgi:poly-gamma-glutamate synthesis protein (capsule biosynthesis protein)
LKDRVVYNGECVIDFLKSSGINAVGLANNHIFDVGDNIDSTIKLLNNNNIQCTGAGKDLHQAIAPLESFVDGAEVVVFAAGWSVVGCQPANNRTRGVVPLDANLLFRLLDETLTAKPNAQVIFYLHWNYELELYPQPAHRQLAFELVRRGAAAIIGTHSHCVQGIERVGDGVIVHGLGNWMFPHHRFFNGMLAFPEFSKTQIACQIDVKEKEHRIFWYEFEDNHQVVLKNQTGLESDRIDELTPYKGMSHSEYIGWFRQNRRKKKLLPIYADYRHRYRNFAKNRFVRTRQFALDKLVELGLKGSPK